MTRGANVSLTREIPNLRGLVLGAKWNAGSERVLDDNLVFAALLCDHSGRVRSDRDFVFFNQIASAELSVQQLEQALGDDNVQIEVDLAAVPGDIERIVCVLYVNEGPAQRRTLGQLRSCAIRVLNLDGNAELVRSEELATGFDRETAVALGEVYRHRASGQDEWKFKVLGQGYSQGIGGIASDYGVPL
ncbi:TerD family protein [Jatrophihabitans endophyticus]|nr:TerD family protein [Jatrophihabitans endophyticus]